MDMVLLNMGQPFMEVFLRKDADTGRLRSCATAILPSEDTEVRNMPATFLFVSAMIHPRGLHTP